MTPTRTAAAGAVIACFSLQLFAQTSPQFADATFQFDSCKYSDGPRTLTVNATDEAGNVGSTTITVNIANRPSAAISYPIDGAKVGGQVLIQAASASGCSCTQTLAIDGKVVASGVCGAISYQWFATKAGKGKHTITLTATNAAGDSAVAQITVTV